MSENAAPMEKMPAYIHILDFFRAVAILLVMFFHFWQQSWIPTSVTIGSFTLDFGMLAATGFMGVELLFVLSGFCLYYPIVRKGGQISWGDFYKKRVMRIYPCFILAVVVMSIFPLSPWSHPVEALTNITGTLIGIDTFSSPIFFNKINGVLWSLFVEMQFYLLAPLFVKAMKKQPLLCFAVTFVLACVYRQWAILQGDGMRLLMNQFAGMADAFIGGMFGAYLVGILHQRFRDGAQKQKRLNIACTVGLGAFLVGFFVTLNWLYQHRYDNLQIHQLQLRPIFVLLGMGLLICGTHSLPLVGKALGNRVVRFIAGISYNLYLWHAWIAVKLRNLQIPPYVGEDPHMDPNWQWQYTLLCWVVSFTVAILITYVFEKPMTRMLRNQWLGSGKKEVPGKEPKGVQSLSS